MPTAPAARASQRREPTPDLEPARPCVAVVAHTGKSLGGGLAALREVLERAGFSDPIWLEVTKSKQAPKKMRQACKDGADLVFVWGGDGMVQRCVDALMIRDAPGKMKDRVGKLAYLWTGARNLGASRVRMRIKVDGEKWFDGKASCVLVGNVGKILGGVTAFEDAEPDDGILELGVVTASGVWQWTRALARTAAGNAERSPFVSTTRGADFDIRMRDPWPYELDGGARKPARRLRVKVVPASITIAVPDATP